MRAVAFTAFGDPENLEFIELPDPRPAEGEVLVTVGASTINPVETLIQNGTLRAMTPAGTTAPYVIGFDLAGTVVAVGKGVEPELVGTHVLGFSQWFMTGHGTQASLVALPRENIAVAAGRFTSAELTTFGLNGVTALFFIEAAGNLRGRTVLVTGATGAVGGFAVQLAAAQGATIIAPGRESEARSLRDKGVSTVVPREGDLTASVRAAVPGGVDVLLNAAPPDPSAVAAVRDGGTAVSVVGPIEVNRGIHAIAVQAMPDRAKLEQVVALAENGDLALDLEEAFPAERAPEAYRAVTERPGHGRIVLTF